MKSAVEPLEGNKVKLSVEIDEGEFDKALDQAFRKIAREFAIPGFRPGKAPRRLLEARLGSDVARSEALRDALPGYYERALRESDIDAIAAPEIDITAGKESGAVSFDAVVEVRPRLHLVGYGGLRITIPSPEVTDDDINAQIDRLRHNFGQLTAVERPARGGDHLTIDLSGTRDGEPLAALTTEDFVYELGSGTVLPELDQQLAGAKPGDIFSFEAQLPDGPAQLRVLVKEVKETILPEVTDDWASEASEFDTVEELRADIARRLTSMKRTNAVLGVRNGAIDAVVELVDEEPPTALVDAEVERRVHDLGHRLEGQGVSLEQFLEATGQSAEELVAEVRQSAVPAVKADLALRAVAEAEELDATDEEMDAEIERLAQAYGTKVPRLRRELERTNQLPAVRSDLRKGKALEWLVEHAELVDDQGQPVDRSLLEPDSETSEVGATEPAAEGESSDEAEGSE